MKQVIWHSTARIEIKKFTKEVKHELGYLIYRLQKGDILNMPLSKPIPAVGSGVSELRFKGSDGAYRVFYYLKSKEGILIIHCFKKKSQKTPLREIRQGMKNLKELLS